MKSRTTTAKLMKLYALRGAKTGAAVGLGLGIGAGVLGTIAAPVITTFYSKWDLTKPTDYPLRKSIPTFAVVGAGIGAAGGALLGGGVALVRVAGAAAFSFSSKKMLPTSNKSSIDHHHPQDFMQGPQT